MQKSEKSARKVTSYGDFAKALDYVRANREMFNALGRSEANARIHEDIGVTIHLTGLKEIETMLGFKFNQRRHSGVGPKSSRVAKIARILRDIGRALGALTPEDDAWLSSVSGHKPVSNGHKE